jgi:hypothetical protein
MKLISHIEEPVVVTRILGRAHFDCKRNSVNNTFIEIEKESRRRVDGT